MKQINKTKTINHNNHDYFVLSVTAKDIVLASFMKDILMVNGEFDAFKVVETFNKIKDNAFRKTNHRSPTTGR